MKIKIASSIDDGFSITGNPTIDIIIAKISDNINPILFISKNLIPP